MIKIAFNAVRVSNKAGSGFDTFIINFINEFAKYVYSKPELNIDFDVYTLYPHHFPEVKKENIRQIKLPFLTRKVSSVYGQYCPLQENKNSKSLLSSLTAFLTTLSPLLSTIRSTLADYFRMFWTQFVFPFYVKKYDLVVAMTQLDVSAFCKNQSVIFYDLIPFVFTEDKHKHKWFLKKILPMVVSKLKLIFSISMNTKVDIIKFFNVEEDKIKVIYAGVKNWTINFDDSEIRKFRQKYKINRDYILFVGGAQKHKNLLTLMKAFRFVQEKIDDISLVVIGYFPDNKRKFIEQSVKDLNLISKIKFLGHISADDLQRAYCCARLFVFPSLYEGFGLPPLEAMACGCPVVVSNCGSLPEVCGDAAVYVNPYDPEDIANGILKVLTDESLRQDLIKKGFEQVKKFSWENSVKKFVELLKNLQNNGIK